ncbi:hypothetical protein [Bradyrhizobium sp.]|uniref:hypothetical protein n=1 Tax=Bradyrhizobium sp. TaxID=376 RepID=UPI0027343426|nr:hypothetical protein [Bradyrhizobium sp.]MDP3074917.1 hypothetical protein [Bradyrhizobium sp.]
MIFDNCQVNHGNDQSAPVLRSTQAVWNGDALSQWQSTFACLAARRYFILTKVFLHEIRLNFHRLRASLHRCFSFNVKALSSWRLDLGNEFSRCLPLEKPMHDLHGLAPVQPRGSDLPDQGLG